ncbi:dihydropteroate synthase [Paenalkalicoccus suaedae]|nr:dihydropteroate synthase [Paenalkalicoccus suaedae]
MYNQSKITWDRFELDFSRKTYIMGILNVTPDSFSDGGSYSEVDRAVMHAQKMVSQGADIIDLGGESTRPGATKVEELEELQRVLPSIRAIREALDTPISIDTYKATVAEEAILAGANIINDVWGAKADPRMAEVAARYDVPIVLMHNREAHPYNDIIEDMKKDLLESVDICLAAGVKANRIILDPGIGFAKTHEENLYVMRHLSEFTTLGFPLLLGTSRKSLIAKTLDLPVDQRVEGTGATVCRGIDQGCSIVRVHDILEMSRMAKMMDAMVGKGDNSLAKSM